MAYEYTCPEGVVRLVKVRRRWKVEFGGDQAGNWTSANAALSALLGRTSGIPALDQLDLVDLPKDLSDWRPLDDSL